MTGSLPVTDLSSSSTRSLFNILPGGDDEEDRGDLHHPHHQDHLGRHQCRDQNPTWWIVPFPNHPLGSLSIVQPSARKSFFSSSTSKHLMRRQNPEGLESSRCLRWIHLHARKKFLVSPGKILFHPSQLTWSQQHSDIVNAQCNTSVYLVVISTVFLAAQNISECNTQSVSEPGLDQQYHGQWTIPTKI